MRLVKGRILLSEGAAESVAWHQESIMGWCWLQNSIRVEKKWCIFAGKRYKPWAQERSPGWRSRVSPRETQSHSDSCADSGAQWRFWWTEEKKSLYFFCGIHKEEKGVGRTSYMIHLVSFWENQPFDLTWSAQYRCSDCFSPAEPNLGSLNVFLWSFTLLAMQTGPPSVKITEEQEVWEELTSFPKMRVVMTLLAATVKSSERSTAVSL